MSLVAIDLGGTKLAIALYNDQGEILDHEKIALEKRIGNEVGLLIIDAIRIMMNKKSGGNVEAIGVAVPGIYHIRTGKVWAPNIPGWEDYPLLEELKNNFPGVHVAIDSDRACYILGESWKGNAQRTKDAIYLAVGTGIGAGILTDGHILRGAQDIGGAIGWMALKPPFKDNYVHCGCFENYASGEGIVKTTKRLLGENTQYTGELKEPKNHTAAAIFRAYANDDPIAKKVIHICVEFWGMACANLISLFNPEKIIFGGGVFGPAISLIPEIKKEAAKWAQPISMQQVTFEASGIGNNAGLYGAARLAMKKTSTN